MNPKLVVEELPCRASGALLQLQGRFRSDAHSTELRQLDGATTTLQEEATSGDESRNHRFVTWLLKLFKLFLGVSLWPVLSSRICL